MKSVLCILLSVTLLSLMVTGCEKTTAESKIHSAAVQVDVIKYVPAKNKLAVQQPSSTGSLTAPYMNDAEKFVEDGVSVIRGKVKSTEYVIIRGSVFTKSQVEIETCYKGGFKKGDTVCVREMGGFVPSDVYNNAIYQEKFGTDAPQNEIVKILDIRFEDFKVMEPEEEVILFLLPVPEYSTKEFDGCYDLIRVWQGKLLYDEQLDAYVPYIPEFELSKTVNTDSSAKYKLARPGTAEDGVQARIYTLEEFEQFVEQCKNK